MLTFGQVVRAQRQKLGLTLDAVAKRAGTHKGYVSGIETGKVSPPLARVTGRLCSILEMNEEEMLLLAWAEKAPKEVREKARSWFKNAFGW